MQKRTRTLATTASAALLSAAMLIPATSTPAWADTTKCDNNVCMTLFGSGRRVNSVTVQLLGVHDNVALKFHYFGNDDHGSIGPDKTVNKTCFATGACAVQIPVNTTYTTSTQVCSTIFKSGSQQGFACKEF